MVEREEASEAGEEVKETLCAKLAARLANRHGVNRTRKRGTFAGSQAIGIVMSRGHLQHVQHLCMHNLTRLNVIQRWSRKGRRS